jgi:hypothetical protein
MPQFHETGYGARFFQQQLPDLTEHLGRIAKALEKAVVPKSDKTPTEKLYDLYAENKASHSKDYVDELMNQIELFATESNTLSKADIAKRLTDIIIKSKNGK